MQVALAVGDDQLRPELPSSTDLELQDLANACFESDPLSRPSFSALVGQLSAICSRMDKQLPQQQTQTGMFGRFRRGRT